MKEDNNTKNKNQSINEERRKLLSLAGAAIPAALLSPLLSKAAPSTVIEAGSNVDTASYIIFKDGNTIYTKNGMTGKIEFQNTDASTVINDTLKNLTSGRTWKEKVVLKGNFLLTNRISISSYTIFEIQGKLTLANNTNFYMIESNPNYGSDLGIGAGATDIEINGGILDANRAGQSTTKHTIAMKSVKNLRVSNIKLLNGTNWAMAIARCQKVMIDNIYVESDAVIGLDGVHLIDCIDAKVDGVKGNTGDDLVSITNQRYDSNNITIDNIIGTSFTANVIAITNEETATAGKILSDIIVNNVVANAPSGDGIMIYSRAACILKNVVVNNVVLKSCAVKGIACENNGGTLYGISISNFIITSAGINSIKLLTASDIMISNGYISNAVETCLVGLNITNLLVSNVSIKNSTPSVHGIYIPNGYKIAINNVHVESQSYAFWYGGDASTTINKLRMTGCYAKGSVSVELRGNIIDAIISNNDLKDSLFAIQSQQSFIPINVMLKNNIGYKTENKGSSSISDGGTISHNLVSAPTSVRISPSIAGEFASVTSISSTNFTVAIKKPDGSSGTTQTIYWEAEV